MIIRSLSIQSHDKLGTPVFKLMIIFVCCIQTQLIIFMPHAGRCAFSATRAINIQSYSIGSPDIEITYMCVLRHISPFQGNI